MNAIENAKAMLDLVLKTPKLSEINAETNSLDQLWPIYFRIGLPWVGFIFSEFSGYIIVSLE